MKMQFRMKTATDGMVTYTVAADGATSTFNTLTDVPPPYRNWFKARVLTKRWRIVPDVAIDRAPWFADFRLTKNRPSLTP